MATPTTRDFTFKWASTETERGTASTTINYTSTTSIPIWRYNKLQKIVVKTGSIKNPIGVIDTTTLNFTLFDKNRPSNPALTDNNPFNLHDELLNFEKLLDTKILRYGQPYNHMYYVNGEGMKKPITDFYNMGIDRTFNVTYTYEYFEYVTPKNIGLPLQFLFNDYNFTASDVTKYRTMGYTLDDLIKAGLKYSQLLNAGYNIIDDLFPVLFEPSGIAVQCIEAINNLKNNITQLTANNGKLTDENSGLNNECAKLNANNGKLTDENSVLTDDVTRLTAENSGLNNECAKLNDNNGKLTDENNSIKNINTILNRTNKIAINTNDLLQTTNNTLHSTNTALKVTNDLLQTTNNTLHSTNTALRTLQTRVPLHDSIPDDKDYYIKQED